MDANNYTITPSSNTTESTMYTTSYTREHASVLENHQIMSGGLGMGKVVIPPLTTEEKELWESLGSSAAPPYICRRMEPSPIRGPPGQFEDDLKEKMDVERLMQVTAILRAKNRKLEETVSELKRANLDMIDNFHHLCISTSAKLRLLAKALGNEDLLEPPSP